jgi:putative endonuclease
MNVEHKYYVYIMTNKVNTTLYTGVTNNIQRRVLEHRSARGKGFARKYKVTKFVYFESTDRIESAIYREKQIKGGSRRKKIELIESMNPEWVDLYEQFFS